MTTIRLATLTALLVAATTPAFAQSGRTAMDPLVATAQMVYSVTANPRVDPRYDAVAPSHYEVYMAQYNQYLADYARYAREIQVAGASSNNWGNFLQGVSDTLAVADQGVRLQQQFTQAKTLSNLSKAVTANPTPAGITSLSDYLAAMH